MPGFDAELASIPLSELEARDSNVIELFRQAGGAGLTVPRDLDGHGASALDGIRVQRALGARSPSLAVGVTMHHFSIAALVELWKHEPGDEAILLRVVATENKLVASGFAEGKHGQGVLHPTMKGRHENGNVVISGVKKPCSLSRSMDILSASLHVTDGDGKESFAMAVIPAELPGIEVSPFWASPVLAGAQSDAITLTDVAIPEDFIVPVDEADESAADIESAALIWFQLLMTASYLGIASALVERLLEKSGGEAWPRVQVACELEASMAALEGCAARVDAGEVTSDLLTKCLLTRFAIQDAITRAVSSTVEQLGGMAFIGGEDVAYFSSASRALAFHPPPRLRTAEALADALRGRELVIA